MRIFWGCKRALIGAAVLLGVVAGGLAGGLGTQSARADGPPAIMPAPAGTIGRLPSPLSAPVRQALTTRLNGYTAGSGWQNLGDGNWLKVTSVTITGYDATAVDVHFDFKYLRRHAA